MRFIFVLQYELCIFQIWYVCYFRVLIVRTRIVLINILSFDDNIIYEFCIRQCGTLILCIFHFRKYVKSMHNSAQEALTQKVQVCNSRTCSRKTSEDGQAESEHGLLKHQKNLSSEAEALQFL